MSHDYFRVRITHQAKKMLRDVGKKYGRKTYETLRDLILDLEFQPEKKGQALRHPLQGFHSLHHSRFRIVYRIEHGEAIVLVVGAGFHTSDSRSDVYKIIARLVEQGHLKLDSDDKP